MKRVIKKINKIIKTKSSEDHHPKDIEIEKRKSETALAELELRDR